MKKIVSSIALSFVAICAFAQHKASEFENIIHKDSLYKHLSAIAGDEMEGRNSGARGERLSAAYMQWFFKEHNMAAPQGLPHFAQHFLLKIDSRKNSDLSINGNTLNYPDDYMVPVTDNRNASFNSDALVFAGYGIQDNAYNDYKHINVKGKTVVFILDEPKDESGNYLITGTKENSEWGTFRALEKKLELAVKKGATGALIISPTQKQFTGGILTNAENSRMYIMSAPATKPLNYAVLSHGFVQKYFAQGNNWLQQTGKPFQKNDYITLKENVAYNFERTTTLLPSANIAAVIEGTDKKDEFVFITAHYDHLGVRDGNIYNGADDDGSGTVAIMQIGQAFAAAKAAGKGPRRTVIILAFTAEEKGLLGSRYFSENPFVDLNKVSAALNIDMIGRIDTERMLDDTLNYIYVVGHDKISTDLKPVSEGANARSTQLVFDYKFDHPDDKHRIYFRSDHYHFARKGVPVLFFYDGMLKSDYHKPTDTYEKINWTLYEKRARLVFNIAWEIANRDEMLTRDLPIPTGAR